MKFLILTLFPEFFANTFSFSMMQKAIDKKIINIEIKNIRDFATGKRKNVDDKPFGGGAGMILKPEPVAKSIEYAKAKLKNKAHTIFLTPQGKKFTQKKAQSFAKNKKPLIILCGHFEGVDERVRKEFIDEEISMGEFILTGGEIPALAMIDAVSRLLPHVLGNKKSLQRESFSEEIFWQKEFPHFTRPQIWRGKKVPEVLLNGHHKKIENWQINNLRDISVLEKKILNLRLQYFPHKTKNTILRLPQRSDIDFWLKWVNDLKVTKGLIIDPPLTRKDEEDFYENFQKNLKNILLTIEDKSSKKPIGNVSISVNHTELNQFSADFGLMIGEKDFWNKGLGSEIVKTILKFAFEKLNLIKVQLRVFAENKAAIRIYEKCGFKKVGELKKEVYKKDGFHDCFLMEKWKK